MKNGFLYILPLFVFAALVGIAFWALQKPDITVVSPPPQAKEAPAFAVTDLTSEDLPDEAAVVNFFASWCVPCEAEHPWLVKISETAPVYGIAFMDEPEKTEAFLERLGNPFTQVGHDTEGLAAAEWGIVGVPTTFVIRDDKIIYRLDGPLTADLVRDEIMPYLEDTQ